MQESKKVIFHENESEGTYKARSFTAPNTHVLITLSRGLIKTKKQATVVSIIFLICSVCISWYVLSASQNKEYKIEKYETPPAKWKGSEN